jgi:hypothetical protein
MLLSLDERGGGENAGSRQANSTYVSFTLTCCWHNGGVQTAAGTVGTIAMGYVVASPNAIEHASPTVYGTQQERGVVAYGTVPTT